MKWKNKKNITLYVNYKNFQLEILEHETHREREPKDQKKPKLWESEKLLENPTLNK